jgi:hypothetical protein
MPEYDDLPYWCRPGAPAAIIVQPSSSNTHGEQKVLRGTITRVLKRDIVVHTGATGAYEHRFSRKDQRPDGTQVYRTGGSWVWTEYLLVDPEGERVRKAEAAAAVQRAVEAIRKVVGGKDFRTPTTEHAELLGRLAAHLGRSLKEREALDG